jgi:hypothetical protein
MKKSSKSKLKLNRETLVALEESQMGGALGAGSTSNTCLTLGVCSAQCGSTTIYASGCYSRCTCGTALC